jgi:DNA mismatch repair protein MutS2
MLQQNLLEKLEFPRILKFISRYAVTSNGKIKVENLRPFSGKDFREEGDLVSQAKEILIKSSNLPFENLPDLTEELSLSRIDGALLSAPKILAIYRLAVCSREILSFLKQNSDVAPDLGLYTESLFLDKVFEHHITKILDDNGEVKDSASKELTQIRNEINERGTELRKLANRLARDLSESKLMQEDYLTLRDGRIVIPVKAEYKRQIKGFIHSESASGQTVYIEPEETLHLNNEIISLTFAEKREIERLLKELTKKIGSVSYLLKQALDTIAALDCIFARAQYSIEIIGSFPTINDSRPFSMNDARHPLLIQKAGRNNTVPMNLEIGKNRVIIITGPNAGGKTVVLKTVGLLVLMVQAGIHIPASPDSNFHNFSDVFVDIGDQQSIEDDLSTFSSHLSNIKRILDNANSSVLVLLDELGTGTDPSAGAAIGTAVLQTLNEKNATVLASTHHGNLKMLAQSFSGFQNAAMQFDTERLVPTYQFNQGLPGSSYAFEIALRLGFTQSFISTAQKYLDNKELNIEKVLVDIEKKEHELKGKLRQYEVENSRLKGLSNMYEQRVSKLELEKRQILKKTKEEAEQFLKDANKEIERTVKEIKETQAAKQTVKSAKSTVDSILNKTKKLLPEEQAETVQAAEVHIDDMVKIKQTGTVGKVVSVDKEKNSVKILSGNIPMTVKLTQVEPVDKKTVKELSSVHVENFKSNMNYRLDIRGQKPEDAELKILRFIDDAYTNGQDRAEILHGKGTGVLKKMVQTIAKEHIGVSKFYYAPVEYGGEGITIIELS